MIVDLKMCGRWYRGAQLRLATYLEGGVAVLAAYEGEPLGVISVNLPKAPLPGCIWVKDYSENEGVANSLVLAGLLRKVKRSERSGFVTIYEYQMIGELGRANDEQLLSR